MSPSPFVLSVASPELVEGRAKSKDAFDMIRISLARSAMACQRPKRQAEAPSEYPEPAYVSQGAVVNASQVLSSICCMNPALRL